MNKILLLEDDTSLIDGLRCSLKKNGFTVEIVRAVSAAMDRLTGTAGYDLLILDVTLPDGTGFEVCEKVRRQDHKIPIIFLTASDSEAASSLIGEAIGNIIKNALDHMAADGIISHGNTQRQCSALL